MFALYTRKCYNIVRAKVNPIQAVLYCVTSLSWLCLCVAHLIFILHKKKHCIGLIFRFT